MNYCEPENVVVCSPSNSSFQNGIKLRSYVLMHGSFLLNNHEQNKSLIEFVKLMKPGKINEVPTQLRSVFKFSDAIEVITNPKEGYEDMTDLHLIAAFKSYFIEETVKNEMRDWTFQDFTELGSDVLPVFLVGSPCGFVGNSDGTLSQIELWRIMEDLEHLYTSVCRRITWDSIWGITVSSSMISPKAYNYVKKGNVSTTTDILNCLIITNIFSCAHEVGSPFFTYQTDNIKSLFGMVVSATNFYKNQRIHFSVMANLSSVLMEILMKPFITHQVIARPMDTKNNGICSSISNIQKQSVVRITCGSNSGCGTLVDKNQGIFITSADVVDEANDMFIMVTSLWNPSYRAQGKVVFKAPPEMPYKFCLVKVGAMINFEHMVEFRPSTQTVLEGSEVFYIGSSTILKNRILYISAKVLHVYRTMIYLQCRIPHSGSGGAIFSICKNELIGIAVYNIRTDNPIPVCAVIPSTVIGPILNRIIYGDDLISIRDTEDIFDEPEHVWQQFRHE